MSIYKTAVNRPVTTALVFVAVAIFGFFSLSKLSVDLYPEIETNAIMVMTSYSGASAADIETNVSRPIENVLNSVSDLKTMTSKSSEGLSIVSLEFEYGTDIDVATNDVRDKLDMVTTLPDGTSTPILFKFGTEDIPIVVMSVKAKESMPGLYKILDDYVATPLARVSGVGTVSISGIPEREIHVHCDPLKLEAYGLTIEGISSIIASENLNTPAGSIDIGSHTYSTRVQQEFIGINEILNLVVGVNNGATVYLKDIATVEDTQQERAQEVFIGDEIGGIIVIQKQSGANSVNIAEQIEAIMPQLQANLPSDVEIGMIINTSENIVDTINSLKRTIAMIFIIVIFVVLVFLERWRATFVIILTIPISLLGALVYLLATGNTLNIISMSALSIAIGMVVDNAIVVLENITTHIERGSRPKQAAIFATQEVGLSVMASTLTTIAVFLPLTMVSGMAGILFRQLGWMVTIILTISTLAALTLTPMLCSRMLRLSTKKSKFQQIVFGPTSKGLRKLDVGYEKLLNWAVRNRTVVISCAVAMLAASILFIAPQLKTEFFPSQDNARISLSVELPVGTRQEITREVALDIQREFVEKYPEIRAISVTEGSAASDNVFASLSDNGSHIISYNIALTSMEERERTLFEIGALMRQDLNQYPQIRTYTLTEGGSRGGVGGQTSVDIDIIGYDFDETDRIAQQIKELMIQDPSCSEVTISRDQYTPEFQIEFDREKLALNSLNVSTAATYLRNRINGSTASMYREDGDEYDIIVRYAKEYRQTIDDIQNITIYNALGNGVKIRDVATVVEALTPPSIEREDRERIITVSCIAEEGFAMSEVVAAGTRTMEQVEIPSNITWKFGGSFEDQQDTFSDMFLLMALIVILVFIVMASQFESFSYPLVIMFSIPFAVIGVLLGLWITGTPLGVMALLGILMLIGIVVNNGIVLIDYINLCRERGMGIIAAITTSGRSRLRPILMTTMTTVLGMVPMATGTGTGSEMWRPLGMSVAWGLSFSTLITLILIPVLYGTFAAGSVNRTRKQLKEE
ncbi:MAG: efflux RND transporter permease subunit [Rikenellaceae bacterium]